MNATEAVAVRGAASPWDAWDAKLKFAGSLVRTGFCPSAIKTGEQALAIILTGQELGVPPMHALRSIHIIQGKPTLAAELMMALMLRGGVRCTWQESSATKAVLEAKRDTTAFTGAYTIEEAQRAGLTNKDGWKHYPAAMLRARVIALVARVVAPDLISGMYTPEELGADVDAEGQIKALPVATEPEPPAAPVVVDKETGEVVDGGADPVEADVLDVIAKFDAETDIKKGASLFHTVTKGEFWGLLTTSQQGRITAAKNAMKARLGAT